MYPTIEVELSEVRVAAKQPVKHGFPFVIHAPLYYVESLFPGASVISLSGTPEIRSVQICKPAFVKTDILMVRIRFHNGEGAMAARIWDALNKKHSHLLFKNWI